MNSLKKYLADKRKGEFADRLNINRAYLSQLQSGFRRPSYDLMVKIEALTDGAVSLDDWKTDA